MNFDRPKFSLLPLTSRKIPKTKTLWILAFACICFAGLAVLINYSIAPSDFPEKVTVTIKKDMYLSQTADLLAEKGVIKSPFLLKVFVILLGGDKKIIAGDYLFDTPQSVLRIADRIIHGVQGIAQVRITVFAGMTVANIGQSLRNAIPGFDVQTFLTLAKPYEGYLFPDTYFFYTNATPAVVVDMLHDTFNQKIKTELLQIQAFGKPLDEVITMASIVEREASSSPDRKIIAGILWWRLAHNMPLQVDPPFYYVLGKESARLTLKDLAMDSPYNLYKHTGLTPTPIASPSLETIHDTVTPTITKYVYFLSGRDGIMRYAETYEDHLANKRKYID